jgi:site-specific DNA-methyltransferase (adenine-specific)
MINKINNIDCLKGLSLLEDNSINTIITSPPYNKKGLTGKKNIGNQIWKKFNIDYSEYDDNMPEDLYRKWQVDILNECHRVLKPDGSMFYNHKIRRHKNIAYNPYDFLKDSKFNLYQIITWNRKNSPNVRNDLLTPTTELIFWLVKGKPKVFKNEIPLEYRSEVWTISPRKQQEHPAPFHPLIPELCIKLTTEENDLVLDPFAGIGTTLNKSKELNRNFIGFEIDKNYCEKYESV